LVLVVLRAVAALVLPLALPAVSEQRLASLPLDPEPLSQVGIPSPWSGRMRQSLVVESLVVDSLGAVVDHLSKCHHQPACPVHLVVLKLQVVSVLQVVSERSQPDPVVGTPSCSSVPHPRAAPMEGEFPVAHHQVGRAIGTPSCSSVPHLQAAPLEGEFPVAHHQVGRAIGTASCSSARLPVARLAVAQRRVELPPADPKVRVAQVPQP
jgi:hypothetical protein